MGGNRASGDMITPRIGIDLTKILENTQSLVRFFSAQGLSVMGMTKATLASPAVATAMLAAGVGYTGDSRVENIRPNMIDHIQKNGASSSDSTVSQQSNAGRHTFDWKATGTCP